MIEDTYRRNYIETIRIKFQKYYLQILLERITVIKKEVRRLEISRNQDISVLWPSSIHQEPLM